MQVAIALLVCIAIGLTHALIGGTRPIFAYPGYAILGLAGVLSVFLFWKKRVESSTWCTISTVLFLGYMCGRALVSPVPYLALVDLTLLLAFGIVYFLTSIHITRNKARMVVVGLLTVLVVLHVGVGIVQFVQKDQFMLFGIERGEGRYGSRASGLYVCPNHTAGYLEMLGVILMAIILWGRTRLTLKLVAAYMVLACFLGVALSGSRGGYLSTTAGVAVFLVLSLYLFRRVMPERFLKIGVLTSILVIGAMSSGVWLMSQSNMLSDRLANINDKQNMRLQMWEGALEQWKLDRVWGTGAQTYVYYGRQFRTKFQSDPIHTHNDYLQLLAQYGLVGAGLFLFFLATHLANGFRSISHIVKHRLRLTDGVHSDSLALNVGVISAIGALIIHSVLDFNMHIPGNAVFVAFLGGILANGGTRRENDLPVNRFSPAVLVSKLAVVGLSIWILLLVVPRIHNEYYAELSRQALRDGEYSEAVKLAKKALEYRDDNPEVFHHIGEAKLYWAGNLDTFPRTQAILYRDAVENLEKGLALYPQDLWRLISLGQALDGLGRYDDAEVVYDKMVAADPNLGEVYAFYGLHYERRGMDDRALEFYEKGRKLGDPGLAGAGIKRINAKK